MSHEARSIARLVAAVLLVLLLGLPAMASADPSYQARFASAERVILAHEPTIVSWEQRSHIAVAIGAAPNHFSSTEQIPFPDPEIMSMPWSSLRALLLQC